MEDESADEEVGEAQEEDGEQRGQMPLRCLSGSRRVYSWALLGGPLGRLGCFLAVAEVSWGILGASGEPLGVLEAAWGLLRGLLVASWWSLGASWAPLRATLGASWEPPWALLESSWDPPGAFLGPPL